MGTSFSNLNKHGGCYNFGLSSKTIKQELDENRAAGGPVPYPTIAKCDTCRTNTATLLYSDPCCSRLATRSTCRCPILSPLDCGGSSQSHANRIITSETQIDALVCLEERSALQQPTQTHRRQYSMAPVLNESGLSHTQSLQQQQQQQQLHSSQHYLSTLAPQSHEQLQNTNLTGVQDLVSWASPTHIFVTEPELRFLIKSGLIPSCRTVSHRVSHKDDRISRRKISLLCQRLHNLIGIGELTEVYLARLRDLIWSWSYGELFTVYAKFEALTKLHTVAMDAVNTRPQAPTLEEDLRYLCSNSWCYNLKLAYHGVLHGAHSYILASRSKLFADVLCTLYSLHTGYSQTSAIAPNLTIIIPERQITSRPTLLIDPILSIPVMSIEDSPPRPPLVNSPDIVPNHTMEEPTTAWRSYESPSTQRLNKPQSLTKLPSLDHSQPNDKHVSEQERKFRAFLQDIYCGVKRSDEITDQQQHTQQCNSSMRKSKPDLLCGSTMTNTSPCSLRILYEELTHDQFISTSSPLAPDCQLIFASSAVPASTDPHVLRRIPCHAGVLAARSQFLRRILIKRYQLGASGDDLTTIVLDSSLVQPHFAETLLHFFYTDQLSLNGIARVVRDQSELSDRSIPSTCYSVTETHLRWHQNHHSCSTCCQSGSDDVDTTKNWCKSSVHTDTLHKLSAVRFCLACPFCLAHILELHPVGQYLEFPRLTEACEDVVVKALRLAYHDATILSDKEPSIHSLDHRLNCNIEMCELTQRMTPISLAVGLIHWADGASTTSHVSRSSLNSLEGTAGQSEQLSVPSDPSRNDHLNCNGLSASVPISQVFTNDAATTRYLYRQAMQCLRQHFMFLARSPTVLRRLTPKQLNELLDSDFVQAPECEILAALLCWSELYAEHGHAHVKEGQRSTDSSRGCELSSISYTTLVTSLTEQSWFVCNGDHKCYPRWNPWLLLGASMSTTRDETTLGTMDFILNNNDSSNNQTPSVHKTLTEPRSKCDLCDHLVAAIDETSEPLMELDEMTVCKLGFSPVNLDELVRRLHRYGLLDHIRPAYLLNSIPLGLATTILQYQLGTAASVLTTPLCKQASSLSFGLDRIGTSFEASTDDATVPSRKSARFARWFPLLTTTMRLLRPVTSEVNNNNNKIKKARNSSVHPLLASKIGNGPLTDCPTSSPAQTCAHSVWIRTQSHWLPSKELNHVPHCECHWAIRSSDAVTEGVNQRTTPTITTECSSSFGDTASTTSTLDAMSPRLYTPFMSEIRAALIAKSPFPFNHLELDVFRSTNTNSVEHPRCTCVRLLSSLSGHHLTPTNRESASWAESLNLIRPAARDQPSGRDVAMNHLNTTVFAPPLTQKHLGRMSMPSRFPSFASSASLPVAEDSMSCCLPNCKEFAHCLLNVAQWEKLLTRYGELVDKFVTNNSDASLLIDCNQLARFFRLHVLREQGIPDSLESLLACRVNEQFIHQRRLLVSSVVVPPTNDDASPFNPGDQTTVADPVQSDKTENENILNASATHIVLGQDTIQKDRCIFCPPRSELHSSIEFETLATGDLIRPTSDATISCAACETDAAVIANRMVSMSRTTDPEGLTFCHVPCIDTHDISPSKQLRSVHRRRHSLSAHPKYLNLTSSTQIIHNSSHSKSDLTPCDPHRSRASQAVITYQNHHTVFHPVDLQLVGAPTHSRNRLRNSYKNRGCLIRPLSSHDERSAYTTFSTRLTHPVDDHILASELECSCCVQLAQQGTSPGVDPCALSLAMLSDEGEQQEEDDMNSQSCSSLQRPWSSLIRSNYLTDNCDPYKGHPYCYYYHCSTTPRSRQSITIATNRLQYPQQSSPDPESQVGFVPSMTSSCSSYKSSSSCLSGLSKSFSDVSEIS